MPENGFSYTAVFSDVLPERGERSTVPPVGGSGTTGGAQGEMQKDLY